MFLLSTDHHIPIVSRRKLFFHKFSCRGPSYKTAYKNKPNKNTVSVLSDGKVKIFYWRLWYKLWKLIISSDKPYWFDACLCCHYRFSTSTFRMASLTNAVTQFSTEADLQQVGYLILSLKCSCAKSSTVFAFRGMCRRSCTLKIRWFWNALEMIF